MPGAGFGDVAVVSRNACSRAAARAERARLRGPEGTATAARVGRDVVEHNIALWDRMIGVPDPGAHCPSHLRATRPR